jgi:hypothetical protein
MSEVPLFLMSEGSLFLMSEEPLCRAYKWGRTWLVSPEVLQLTLSGPAITFGIESGTIAPADGHDPPAQCIFISCYIYICIYMIHIYRYTLYIDV